MYDKKKYKRVKFGRDSRDSNFGRKTPGPGTYDPGIVKFESPRN